MFRTVLSLLLFPKQEDEVLRRSGSVFVDGRWLHGMSQRRLKRIKDATTVVY